MSLVNIHFPDPFYIIFNILIFYSIFFFNLTFYLYYSAFNIFKNYLFTLNDKYIILFK